MRRTYDRNTPPGPPAVGLVRVARRNETTIEPAPSTPAYGRAPDVSGAQGDEELVSIWMRSKNLSHNTRRAYTGDVANLFGFLYGRGRTMRSTTVGDMSLWMETLTGAPASIARRMAAAKSLFSFGQRTGYLTFNVGSMLKLPKIPDHLAERILTEDQVLKLLRAAKGLAHGPIIDFMYSTGARVSEAVSVTWRQVHERPDGGATITLHGKGDKTRTAQMSAAYYAPLKAARGDAKAGDLVFHTNQGHRVHPTSVWKTVRAAAKKADIEEHVSSHWFRHAHASHAMDHGAPVSMVRDSLGHSSLATTGRYVHAKAGDGSGNYLRAP
jgi:integrase/recombinase XerD